MAAPLVRVSPFVLELVAVVAQSLDQFEVSLAGGPVYVAGSLVVPQMAEVVATPHGWHPTASTGFAGLLVVVQLPGLVVVLLALQAD